MTKNSKRASAANARAARAMEVARRLHQAYPQAVCSLEHRDPWQLLAATILSAQCTDARVNQVTPVLFERYPDVAAMASAQSDDVSQIIHSCGYHNQKTRSLLGAAQAIVKEHGGQVPSTLAELVNLPGVGRKTANCVLGTCYNVPAMVIDTHMIRIMNLLGLVDNKDPVRIEHELMELLPPEEWVALTHRVIEHGRAVCIARRPQCEQCVLAELCPSAHLPARKDEK